MKFCVGDPNRCHVVSVWNFIWFCADPWLLFQDF